MTKQANQFGETRGGEGPLRKLRARSAAAIAVSCAALLSVAMVLATGLVTMRPASTGAIAVQFAPWTDFESGAERVFRSGGVAIAEPGGPGLVWAIGPADDDAFRARLHAEGAWVVLDEDDAFWSRPLRSVDATPAS